MKTTETTSIKCLSSSDIDRILEEVDILESKIPDYDEWKMNIELTHETKLIPFCDASRIIVSGQNFAIVNENHEIVFATEEIVHLCTTELGYHVANDMDVYDDNSENLSPIISDVSISNNDPIEIAYDTRMPNEYKIVETNSGTVYLDVDNNIIGADSWRAITAYNTILPAATKSGVCISHNVISAISTVPRVYIRKIETIETWAPYNEAIEKYEAAIATRDKYASLLLANINLFKQKGVLYEERIRNLSKRLEPISSSIKSFYTYPFSKGRNKE